jgi:putative ABC transport system permease protein
VDSLQKNIVDGFKELGDDVVYIDKQPWNEDPNQNWWKYKNRPDPSYNDFESILKKSKLLDKASYFVLSGARVAKYKNNSVSNAQIIGATYDYVEMQNVDIEYGRFLNQAEYNSGSNKVLLGSKVSEALFGALDPVGREIQLFGQKFQVIGKIVAEGDNMFNVVQFDDVFIIGYPTLLKYVNTNENSSVLKLLMAKVKKGYSLDDLKGELTGILRGSRKLKPRADDNFALNEMSLITNLLDNVFGVLNLAGFFIGGFALIVGMFSVANIMFVSVKERTGIIGIKKAIGAKKFVILLEFLIESIILCMIGGLIGLGLVFGILKIITIVSKFPLALSIWNILIGVGISVIVGILAGIIPAYRASNMDPVEAIRS